jgi:hypothetical protein
MIKKGRLKEERKYKKFFFFLVNGIYHWVS